MLYSHTAIFTEKDGGGWRARFSYLKGCIMSEKTLSGAIDQITDTISVWPVSVEDENFPIPEPTPQHELEIPADDECPLSKVDLAAYRKKTDSSAVRKNVLLPAWMVALAEKRNINCSRVLQEAF